MFAARPMPGIVGWSGIVSKNLSRRFLNAVVGSFVSVEGLKFLISVGNKLKS